MNLNKFNPSNFFRSMISKSIYFDEENKRLIIVPLQIIAALVVVAGTFALMFEVNYFVQFSFKIYFGRLAATLIGFIILVVTNFERGRRNPTLLVHILLLTIITSFASIIYQIPKSLYANSHLLGLVIFTAALFLNWDLKNQVIVAIYYNIIFAASVLFSDTSIYFLPSMFASVLFVMAISLMSIIASSVNYKLRQKALEKTFEARDIFENSSEGIFKSSVNGKILTVNPAFLNMLGYNTESEIIENYSLGDFFVKDTDYETIVKELNEKYSIKNFITELKRPDGNKIIVSINCHATENILGNTIFYEGSFHDVTEQIIAEEKITQYNEELQNLNHSKDKFFSIVAHDLISPFSALLGYSEIISNEFKELKKEQIGEFAQSINSVAKKAHTLLNELLDWSRIQTGRIPFEPENVRIKPLVDDIFALYEEYSKNKNIQLINQTPEEHMVFADLNMLHATFRNLISNAIKFTNSKGEIMVFSEVINQHVLVTIADNGIGMSKEDLGKLFKIDVHHTQIGTGQEKGSGLGLILVKEFINKNGGEITVESEIGKGSKFIFSVALSRN